MLVHGSCHVVGSGAGEVACLYMALVMWSGVGRSHACTLYTALSEALVTWSGVGKSYACTRLLSRGSEWGGRMLVHGSCVSRCSLA